MATLLLPPGPANLPQLPAPDNVLQPGPATAPGARHLTFASLYNDETLDPYRGEYSRVMDRPSSYAPDIVGTSRQGQTCSASVPLLCSATPTSQDLLRAPTFKIY
jgi:hypothetical protein